MKALILPNIGKTKKSIIMAGTLGMYMNKNSINRIAKYGGLKGVNKVQTKITQHSFYEIEMKEISPKIVKTFIFVTVGTLFTSLPWKRK